ncbi:MAG TPA: capsular biosynthesis protein [Caulobacteraceae bacterium]|nr:capsular biosynthesis protein [Caulobacteraceae bacterium]
MTDGVLGSLRSGLSVERSRLSGSPAKELAARARHFLFISAPFGPFARLLAGRLSQSGARSTRILVNGGDVLDWGLRDAVAYFGPTRRWAGWLEKLIHARGVTDIVTYGDSNPYSVAALRLGEELGLRLHVFEQGYFRPDWVTLEPGGVNANSRLPRDPQWYRERAAYAPLLEADRVGRTTPSAVARITRYHTAMYLGLPFFPLYRAPYHHPALLQAVGHTLRFVTQALSSATQKRRQQSLVKSGRPLYLVLLQRPGDSQLWAHSDFEDTESFLDKVVASFAAHAPKDAMLLVRPHPLDHGLDPHERVLRRLARREGVVDRVHYVDHGKLHELLPRVSGAVCVNSTAGLAAVEFGCPTVVLGRALYDMDGLTHQGGLDSFWNSASAPDAALYDDFRAVLMAATQINGAYATRRGRELAVPEAARRLLSGPIEGLGPIP